jgi:ATP-dependent DNA ligase
MGGTTTVTGTAGTKLNTTDVVGSAQMRSQQAVLIPKREVDIDHSKHTCKLGCEGIVSKRLGSPYRSGRSPHWVKVKNPKAPAVKREAEEDWGR